MHVIETSSTIAVAKRSIDRIIGCFHWRKSTANLNQTRTKIEHKPSPRPAVMRFVSRPDRRGTEQGMGACTMCAKDTKRTNADTRSMSPPLILTPHLGGAGQVGLLERIRGQTVGACGVSTGHDRSCYTSSTSDTVITPLPRMQV